MREVTINGKTTIRNCSPAEIEVILHYYYSPQEYPGIAPAHIVAMKRFVSVGLLISDIAQNPVYQITEKGRVFVEGLCRLPFPVRVNEWRMPVIFDGE